MLVWNFEDFAIKMTCSTKNSQPAQVSPYKVALSKGFPLLPNIRDDPLLVRDEMQGQLGLGNAP